MAGLREMAAPPKKGTSGSSAIFICMNPITLTDIKVLGKEELSEKRFGERNELLKKYDHYPGKEHEMRKPKLLTVAFTSGILAATFIAVLTLGATASADPVPILSYDIAQTPESGFGCWFHNYTGIMTDTGHTVSGSVNCATPNPFDPARVLNYSNGSGTLNDGAFDTTHLFMTRTDDQGQPLQPAITLYLDGVHTINEIRLLKGSSSFTAITGATVQIGATAIPLNPIPIGGDPLSVLLDLRGTPLAGLPTNQLTLKDFSASFFGGPIDQFGIGEVEVDGTDVVLIPTSKDQCKNGGWQNFAFENQGQCIKFVNTGE